MSGKHEAPGTGEFWAGLIRHVIMWVLGIAIVLALVFAVVKLLPEWFPGDDAGLSTTAGIPIANNTTSTTTEPGVQPVRTTSTQAGAPPASTTTVATTTPTTTSSVATTTTTAGPVERSPSEITVKVLNSTTIKGLAAGITADLAALGYQMEEQDNYRPTLEESFIYYAPGFQAEAFTLAKQVPGATVGANPAASASADLLVILGTSYSG